MNIKKNIDYGTMFSTLDVLMATDLPQMELYYEIGRVVSDNQEKGAAIAAAEYLQSAYPDMIGFSPRNLRRMREFYCAYASAPEIMAEAMSLGWTQNLVILEADLTIRERLWYIRAARRLGCDYLIDHHRHMEQERTKQNRKGQAKLAYDGRESEFKAMSPVNPFEGKPRTLISLALLFYHSVPVEKFRVFIEPYEDFLKRNRYLLWGEDFPVDQLWETGKIFRTSILQPEWFHSLKERVSDNKGPAESCLMHKETINNLPHRLIHIYAISMDQDGRLTYYMRLGRLNQQICAIEMDYAARFQDYCSAIDADPSKKQRSNLDSLVRKVFKPNQEYPNLLVETYPKTFRRGRNFELPIDHCIRWYILSPFDRDMTMRLRNAYKDSRGTEQVIADFIDGIPGYVAHSEQVAKCVRYVCKQRTMIAEAMGQPLSDHLEQDVRREYTTFLKDCCQILIEQKKLIIDQFRMQKLLL